MAAEWVTTTTILQRLRDFDDPAWEAFVLRFRRPVEAFARERGLTLGEAEDVAQDTLLAFANAYRQGRYSRESGRLSSWLFGIAQNKVRESRRRSVRGAAQPLPDLLDESEQAAWEDAWRRETLAVCLERVRAEVDQRTFDAFEGYAIRNRPAAAVAHDLGVTRNAVFIAKHRVLSRVRELRREYEEIDG
ncbi:MAG: hypothetical protein IBJ10_08755 [Phycisphaerales bacterium]|nr:hypothetical protein [Phycisphaerales bacterium]